MWLLALRTSLCGALIEHLTLSLFDQISEVTAHPDILVPHGLPLKELSNCFNSPSVHSTLHCLSPEHAMPSSSVLLPTAGLLPKYPFPPKACF